AMTRSANDACVALAEYMAGSEPLFGMLMTKKAAIIGARESNFVNASGLPSRYHQSSAYDLVRIGNALQHDPYLKQLVASSQVEVKHPAYSERQTVSNTNRLLTSYPGATGIKTGTTDAAGNCLVAAASREGRNLIAVVLHSNDRYRDSKAILDYGYHSTRLTKILNSGEAYKYLRVQNGTRYRVAVQLARDSQLLMDSEDKRQLQQLVSMDYNPRAKIQKGQKLGQVLVFYCGERVDKIPLIAAEEVNARPTGIKFLWQKVRE
ncbi:MAG: D-alanyl-D-alanine carboxypeptidase family protein, partial [Methanomassiliicoccales archaeon]